MYCPNNNSYFLQETIADKNIWLAAKSLVYANDDAESSITKWAHKGFHEGLNKVLKNYELFDSVLYNTYTAPVTDSVIRIWNKLKELISQYQVFIENKKNLTTFQKIFFQDPTKSNRGLQSKADQLRQKLFFPRAQMGLIQEKRNELHTMV